MLFLFDYTSKTPRAISIPKLFSQIKIGSFRFLGKFTMTEREREGEMNWQN